MHKRFKGITLIELLIAMVLLSIIVLGLNSIDFFSHFHLITSDRRARIQNEASFALEHMSKQITNAIGDLQSPPLQVYPGNREIRIRVDSDRDGYLDVDDLWIGYRQLGSQILFYPDATQLGNSEVIANHILAEGLKVDQCIDDACSASHINRFNITVTARWNSAIPVSLENPEIVLRTTVVAHSVSTD